MLPVDPLILNEEACRQLPSKLKKSQYLNFEDQHRALMPYAGLQILKEAVEECCFVKEQ